MAQAKELPSGSWRVQIYDFTDTKGRKRYRSFTRATKAEAEAAARKWQKYGVRDSGLPDSITKRVEDYIASRDNILSPSTIRSYVCIKDRLTRDYPDFMKMRGDHVTDHDMQEMVNQEAKNRRAKTVRNEYELLCAALDRRFKVRLPRKQKCTYHIPSTNDLERLLDAASDDMKVVIMLGAYCMMRRGEISALHIEDINPDTCVIHIWRSNVDDGYGNITEKDTKTYESDRYIKAPASLVHLIYQRGEVTNFTPYQITRRFTTIRDNLGLKCRFHDLRHYGASMRHTIGVPDAYIMQDGGWSSDKVLKSVYRHAMDEQREHFADMANSAFELGIENAV